MDLSGLELASSLIEKRCAHLVKEDELVDSDIETKELKSVFKKANSGQKSDKKALYQYLTKKVNSIGGIRKLYHMFKDDRRQLLDKNDPKAKISIDYFKVCAMFIPLLETIRKANLIDIYE